MKGTKAIVRYAKALKELAIEQNVLENVYEDMKLIRSVYQSNRDFSILLKNPIIKTDKKQFILREIFTGKISKLSELFLHLLVAKKRESLLEFITTEFIKQYKEHKKILTAVITTVAGIDDELRKKIIATVKEAGDYEVELIEKTNDHLIGGFTLQVGDKRVDASVAKQIRKLTMEFSENLYVKEY